ncbi:alpha-beta hydrolase superfamily lysophospholipase [Salirhabdus euzebyi]|uniref:Alpha-beta hydrolase superfamily lysophospholipase n=1 Tax=Salirhabdus euzebyi TaxID=394506 RepID=A0A841PY17_9BACI|nr:alpha/beta hydrolase [Salirhabdus euzebyi]MBB6451731.1 alpha-beta hydrolase superfamily lysophospholipase [Salirhabdus euzebyi]
MVKEITFSYTVDDGDKIFARKWIEEDLETPKAIVQIAHGMAEHIKRYDDFAEELVANQLFVFGNDHRGHGMTGQTNNNLGFLAEKDGFETVVTDMYALTKQIKEQYPNVPIILFGHSMGSFLSRRYIQMHGEELDGVILSGTNGDPGFAVKLGKMIAKREVKKIGAITASPTLNKLTIGSYNKRFQPARTDADWLTRDQNEVDKYIDDPLCGRIMSAQFYYDLLDGIETINKKANVASIPKHLPVFFIAGDQDPVGQFGKGVTKTYQAFKSAGIKDVTCKLYPGARHEILNETNRKEVYEDVLNWLDEHIKK